MRLGDEIHNSDPDVQVQIHCLMLQQRIVYVVPQNTVGLRQFCDFYCMSSHTEEIPVGKCPWTCLEVKCYHKV